MEGIFVRDSGVLVMLAMGMLVDDLGCNVGSIACMVGERVTEVGCNDETTRTGEDDALISGDGDVLSMGELLKT
jgi:hypothetical protein